MSLALVSFIAGLNYGRLEWGHRERVPDAVMVMLLGKKHSLTHTTLKRTGETNWRHAELSFTATHGTGQLSSQLAHLFARYSMINSTQRGQFNSKFNLKFMWKGGKDWRCCWCWDTRHCLPVRFVHLSHQNYVLFSLSLGTLNSVITALGR